MELLKKEKRNNCPYVVKNLETRHSHPDLHIRRKFLMTHDPKSSLFLGNVCSVTLLCSTIILCNNDTGSVIDSNTTGEEITFLEESLNSAMLIPSSSVTSLAGWPENQPENL
jgi:hypothetical protein